MIETGILIGKDKNSTKMIYTEIHHTILTNLEKPTLISMVMTEVCSQNKCSVLSVLGVGDKKTVHDPSSLLMWLSQRTDLPC